VAVSGSGGGASCLISSSVSVVGVPGAVSETDSALISSGHVQPPGGKSVPLVLADMLFYEERFGLILRYKVFAMSRYDVVELSSRGETRAMDV